ncbi:ABC transporter substrate-binding protein [Herbaspirillum rubrisubalbicans]|uniref:Peptide ABC transporter substrate-binding protein n=1 Tax=Herbaspirillum rubrisubalbicans TaxID=80842 RepID=A0AAD0UA99_9BURK|nr:ABC transporter substrate-binding protein [Herbaspirillum rubrisubalbicans]ALU88931.1 ABC-type dipeptide transport system, periplasmic protein [Herbaspirillum rubrisubalbicans M1]AYR23965.1 peptide ABC transporter substrate-binding protein [Herbaspirillum rubrisubalbicans]
MKQRVSRFLLCAMSSTVLAACSLPTLAVTLNISLDADPGKLDPTQSSMLNERILYQSIFDKLVDLDGEGKIVPMLAERWTVSDDQKTYTLYLRKGVKFQDGTPFDAKAVEFNLLRGQEKTSLRRNELKYVSKITVVDDHTIKLDLSTPFAPFLSILTDRAGMMSSPTAVKKYGEDYVNHPVGTGPFIYEGRLKGATLTLKKNPDYWRAGLPKVDEVVYKIMPDVNVAFNNLRSGQVDISNRFPYKEITNVPANANYTVLNKPSLGFRGFYLNTTKPPFDKKEVREAVDILIDRNAIAKVVYNNAVAPGHSPFSKAQFANGPGDVPPKVDVARAKALLKAAGKEGGFSFKLTLPTTADELQAGQMIQGMLRPAGITVTLEKTEIASQVEAGKTGAFEGLFLGWSGRPDPDQNIFDFVNSGGSMNYSHIAAKEVDDLLQQARVEGDQAKRKVLYDQAMAILVKEVPYIYLVHDNVLFGIAKSVKGFQYVPDGVIRTATVSK